jgi:succinate dehydrogenase flavin-adding protein (antitoxin of CptAB toxin-antitoxin module)
MVTTTDPYDRILDFLDQQLYSTVKQNKDRNYFNVAIFRDIAPTFRRNVSPLSTSSKMSRVSE